MDFSWKNPTAVLSFIGTVLVAVAEVVVEDAFAIAGVLVAVTTLYPFNSPARWLHPP